MSFAPGKLAVLAYANSFTLWHYDTEDEAEQLVAPGYFDAIAKLLRRGDLSSHHAQILEYPRQLCFW